jgi:hypothetical protein
VATAIILDRAGMTDVWQWQDRAILRAATWLNETSFSRGSHYPAGGGRHVDPLRLESLLQSELPGDRPSAAGKNVGWTVLDASGSPVIFSAYLGDARNADGWLTGVRSHAAWLGVSERSAFESLRAGRIFSYAWLGTRERPSEPATSRSPEKLTLRTLGEGPRRERRHAHDHASRRRASGLRSGGDPRARLQRRADREATSSATICD